MKHAGRVAVSVQLFVVFGVAVEASAGERVVLSAIGNRDGYTGLSDGIVEVPLLAEVTLVERVCGQSQGEGNAV